MVEVSEVARSLARFGDRYARRVFSDDELALWPGSVPVRACADLAERFAGKEATIKVLAPGGQGLDWRTIEVRRRLGARGGDRPGHAERLQRRWRGHGCRRGLRRR